ncbi:MAG: hypothetical protein JO041_06375 [Acidobacteria bacterium]|nr:hypothetical protein [Acidobacteriota bacterium]
MLRITTATENGSIELRAEGSLRGPWVGELERAWLRIFDRNRQVRLNLADVSYVDDAGKDLLARMFRHGTELTAGGPFMQAIVEQIKHGRVFSGRPE